MEGHDVYSDYHLLLCETLSPTAAAAAMKIITQTVISTLLLLLVNAHGDINHYATHPFTAPIKSCCDLRIFPPDRVQTGVYKVSMGTFATANVYCDMTTDGGGWFLFKETG